MYKLAQQLILVSKVIVVLPFVVVGMSLMRLAKDPADSID